MEKQKSQDKQTKRIEHYLTYKFDKLIRKSLPKQLVWILAATFVILVMTWIIWQLDILISGEPKYNSLYDMFVHAVNPKFHGEVSYYQGGITIFLYMVVGIGVTGIIFTSLVNLFDRRKDKWENGMVDYGIIDGFSLIIGGHKMVPQLCQDILNNAKNDKWIILIQTNRDVKSLRKEIASRIGKQRMDNIIIYRGDRTEIFDLERLNPHLAGEIYIIGEDRKIDGEDHDTYNIDCLHKLDSLQSEMQGDRRIRCHVMFDQQITSKIFQYTDINISERMEFMPFNLPECWARRVFVTDVRQGAANPFGYLPLHGGVRLYGDDNRQHVHLVIIGMTDMGIAMGVQAALLCHFANFVQNKDYRPKTTITFIDTKIEPKMHDLIMRNPDMFQLTESRYVSAAGVSDINNAVWYDPMQDQGSIYYGQGLGKDLIDVRWEFIDGNAQHPIVRKYLDHLSSDNDKIITIAVCLPSTQDSIRCAMFLPEHTISSPNVIQVLVHQPNSSASVDVLNKELVIVDKEGSEHRANCLCKLKPFGMVDDCDYINIYDETAPKLVKSLYDVADRQKNVRDNEPFDKFLSDLLKQIDEPSAEPLGFMADWDEVTNNKGKSVLAQKWSCKYHADMIDYKAFTFAISPDQEQIKIDDPVLPVLASVEHNRWMAEQLLTGYRPKLKSDNLSKEALKLRKIHADIIQYELLPDGSKLYDISLSQKTPVILFLNNLLT